MWCGAAQKIFTSLILIVKTNKVKRVSYISPLSSLIQTETGKKPLTLWEINQSGNMLDLRYGDIDQEMNDEWSINPYVYLTFAIAN